MDLSEDQRSEILFGLLSSPDATDSKKVHMADSTPSISTKIGLKGCADKRWW